MTTHKDRIANGEMRLSGDIAWSDGDCVTAYAKEGVALLTDYGHQFGHLLDMGLKDVNDAMMQEHCLPGIVVKDGCVTMAAEPTDENVNYFGLACLKIEMALAPWAYKSSEWNEYRSTKP